MLYAENQEVTAYKQLVLYAENQSDDNYSFCIGFEGYCLLARILPANLKKQFQSSRVNVVAEVLLFAICTFAIMVTAQTWFVHNVLNVP